MAGIPITNNRLSEAQQLLLSKIERVTAAQVILREDIFVSNAFEGFLSQPEEAPDEDNLCDMPSPPLQPSPEEYGELCYVADISPKDNWDEYPDSVQYELKTLIADQEPYNWLYSHSHGNSIDEVLVRMEEYSRLLTLGWHIERNTTFFHF